MLQCGRLMLALSATMAGLGCQPAGVVPVPTVVSAESPVLPRAVDQADQTPPPVSEGTFSFPGDRGGKWLESTLPPGMHKSDANDRRSGPLPRRAATALEKIEKPDMPLAPLQLDLPKAPTRPRDALRPRQTPATFILESSDIDPVLPQQPKLPATALLSQKAPDANIVPDLEAQARHRLDRASVDDPTAEYSAQSATATVMPLRTTPAGFWRFNLPEPLVLRGPAPEAGIEVMAPIVRPLR